MAAAMSYRLAPDDPWPAALEDVSLALDFLRSQQVDPERISAWGHSAGGHLALMAGNQPDHGLRCLVALGAPTDLVRLDREGPDSMAPVFQEQCLEAASPLHASTRPESPLPPTLLVHGSMDRVCDVEHARALLKARPDRVELREVAQGDHGLRWPIPEALIARRKALQWLVEQMDLQSRGSKWKIRRRRNR
jgi:acetyl esterase/lipase